MKNRWLSPTLRRGATALLFVIGAAVTQDLAVVANAQSPAPEGAQSRFLMQEQAQIDLFQKVSPSVVQVVGLKARSPGVLEHGTSAVSQGTGFIWDQAGHVVTNSHVVADTRSISVRLPSGDIAKATVVGMSPIYDLAVLSLGGDVVDLPPPIAIGTSANLKIGQFAFAIGNPFGLDQSLTTGIVSALKRRLPTSQGREIADIIQTDAAINPGNSGGPLLDSSGRLIGMTTAIFSPSGANAGIGFAIPVDVVSRIVPKLIADGRVATPGIGIMPADEEIAERLGVDGVIIAQIEKGSGAEKAGLKAADPRTKSVGDVIVGANGQPVRRVADLTAQLDKLGVGQSIDLSILRQGDTSIVQADISDIRNEKFD